MESNQNVKDETIVGIVVSIVLGIVLCFSVNRISGCYEKTTVPIPATQPSSMGLWR